MSRSRTPAPRAPEPLGLGRLPWRRPHPERLPLRLESGRIYILPTRAGLAFGAALLVMLLAAINYNLNLGYGVVFLLAGIALVSLLHTFRNLHGLELAEARVEPVFAGNTLTFAYRVSNTTATRRVAIVLRAPHDTTQLDLAPHAEAEARLGQPTSRRGRIPADTVCIETRWPLGLFRGWSVLLADRSAIVFPAPEPLAPPLPDGLGEGPEGTARRFAGDDFAGLRAHRTSDSPRHVAWKIVAGGGPLLTKEFSGGSSESLQFDWLATSAADIEARAARLAAWVIEAEKRGLRYGLRTPAGEVAPAHGDSHTRACLALLAVTECRDA